MSWLLIDNYLINLSYVDNLETTSSTSLKVNLLNSSWLTFNGLDENKVTLLKTQYNLLKKKHFFKSGKFEAILEEKQPVIKISVTHIEQIVFFYYSPFSNQITSTSDMDELDIVANNTSNRLSELASILNSYLTDKPIYETIEKDFIRPSFLAVIRKFLRRKS